MGVRGCRSYIYVFCVLNRFRKDVETAFVQPVVSDAILALRLANQLEEERLIAATAEDENFLELHKHHRILKRLMAEPPELQRKATILCTARYIKALEAPNRARCRVIAKAVVAHCIKKAAV